MHNAKYTKCPMALWFFNKKLTKIKLIQNNKKACQKERFFTYFLRKSLYIFLKRLYIFLKNRVCTTLPNSNGQSIPFIPVLKLNQWQKSWINSSPISESTVRQVQLNTYNGLEFVV